MVHESAVAIVGAGPYALSLAAHLRVRGVEFRIFGPPMKFWRDMPRGINLKSFAYATNVFLPAKRCTFPDWCRANGLEDFEPCTMESFAAYGMAMKDRFVPEVEPFMVTDVCITAGGNFELTLASEERVRARSVVLATGLAHMAHVPEVLRALPHELATHTFDLNDYERFRGKDVAVIGGGASAIEAGALVHEAGGRAEILVRGSRAIFHDRLDRARSLLERLRYPITPLGPGLKNWVLEKLPLAMHFVPEESRIRFVKTHLGPEAPWWIRDRVEGKVPIHLGTTVVSAQSRGSRVRLHLFEADEGTRTLEVDHVIAGTGYVPDVDRLAYLDAGFRRRIRRVESAPELSMNFESSVRGAYFLGPAAAFSFGPFFRFVAGASYAAPALARHLATRLGASVERGLVRRAFT